MRLATALGVALLYACDSEPIAGAEGLSAVELGIAEKGLRGEYFNNLDFTELRLTRVDPVVDFRFGTGSPSAQINGDTFSARWTGFVQPRFTETYTFITQSDDGVRLTIAGQTLVNQLQVQADTELSGQITLQAGTFYEVRLEYFENTGDARIRLSWASPSQRREVIPESQLFSVPPLPSPWRTSDVGTLSIPGSAQFAAGTFTIRGGGRGVLGTQDAFRLVHQKLVGDGEISARVATVGSTNIGARTGVMIRESLSADSPFVMMSVAGSNGTLFERRRGSGGETVRTAGPAMPVPTWVRLVRSGNVFTSFVSPDGQEWLRVRSDTVVMPPEVFLGLVVTAGSDSRASTSTFTGVLGGRSYAFLTRDGNATRQSALDYYDFIGASPGLTLDQWIQENLGSRPRFTGFYRNALDLGFWREMECSQTIGRGFGGCWVRNWAAPDDKEAGRPNLGTVTMNVSRAGFTQFFVFGPDGVLSPLAILDSEEEKFVPELCTTCHGGSPSGLQRGADLGSVWREFEPSALERRPGVSQAQAEREWFDLNQVIRLANAALASEAEGGIPGIDRDKASILAYVDSLYIQRIPAVALDLRDPAHLPPSWRTGPNSAFQTAKANFWSRVVSPYCMGCHRLSPLNFSDYNRIASLNTIPAGSTRSLLEQYLFENPSDPLRTELPFMPQAELMVNLLNEDAAARAAVQEWLTQSANPNVPQSRVTFVLNGIQTSGAQEVRIVGNTPELGNMNPLAGGRLMQRTSTATWVGNVALPQRASVQFKFVVMQNGTVVREEAGAPHVVNVSAQSTTSVSATFQ